MEDCTPTSFFSTASSKWAWLMQFKRIVRHYVEEGLEVEVVEEGVVEENLEEAQEMVGARVEDVEEAAEAMARRHGLTLP